MIRVALGVLLLFPALAHAQATPTLGQLLQQERKLLREEAEALRAQRQALITERDELRRVSNQELDALSARLVELRSKADALQLSTQAAPVSSQAPASFDDLVARAQGTWATPLLDGEPQGAAIDTFAKQITSALGHLHTWRGVREESASYFNGSGAEEQGTVRWLSRVAAWGPRGEPLVQLAGDRLVLTEAVPAPAPAVSAWLFDPAHPPADLPASGGLWATFVAGGVVMWPILLLGLFALVVVCERMTWLWRVRQRLAPTLSAILPPIYRREYTEAIKLSGSGALGRVLKAVLEEQRAGTPDRRRLEDVATAAILALRPSLERSLSLLNVIAMVAPLLGLLGTVTGMIDTFSVITEVGTSDPRRLSGGISQALLTTQFGLTVAIPVVLVHGFLARWAERVLGEMETAALMVLNAIETPPELIPTDDAAPPHSQPTPVILAPVSHGG